ncbi:hypothetical protein [Thiothrix lacustris]|uniref:hypothetical protein n=1 Tax=Thiothrix lacustris TaxID=525917 RepID=UPI0004912C30|nr:hypothetical protein [Thiothrix lacustris]
MGKWLDRLKSHSSPEEGGFVSFGSSTTGHIAEFATREFKREGVKRLETVAQGLPVTLAELEAFFAHDLQEFGNGGVTMATIKQVVEWYAYQHKGRAKPEPEEIPVGMVRCTDCLQDRCKYRQVTPWGDVVMQSSPQWRWCREYTARVHNLSEYRKR